MNLNQKGFGLLELAIVVSLSAMIALTATTFSFHAFRTSGKTQDHLIAVSDVENAGYWMSRDALMADGVITENLTFPAILVLEWTEWGYDEDNIYYSATYSVDNLTDGIGTLSRRLQNSTGGDQSVRVASNIYYNPADPDNSTNVTYESPTINLKVATRSGTTGEIREYQIYRRPNF